MDTQRPPHQSLYDRMLKALHKALGHEQPSAESLDRALDEAAKADKAEQTEPIKDWLKRDLTEAAAYLKDSERDMADWLHMDMELIEWSILDLFSKAADHTAMEWWLLKARAENPTYLAGEIAAPGRFECVQCDEVIEQRHNDLLPQCPNCGAHEYRRVSR